jgi:glyoxylase-like metal-dependent hydrolase (beta-lactamase superfamily II)
MTLPNYEIFALRYATMPKRTRRENFITHDPHDEPMPMDYFVWLIRGEGRTIMVDTGFNAEQAKQRGRTLTRCPVGSLALLGVAPEDVQDVVITHLHYDHAGNIDLLPNAKFHIQDGEMDYACGRHMCQGLFRHAYNVEDVVALVRRVYADRVVFHDGRETRCPGIELI